MSQVDQTAEEFLHSLTGFDEIAVAQHFGRTVTDLGAKDQMMFGRALVFVALRRHRSMNDDDARNAALSMTFGDATSFFAEESEDAGKDEPASEPSPPSSLSSVS